jgi:hypothetical protein
VPDHRAPRPSPPARDPGPAALRRTLWILVAVNAGTAGILSVADRGSSPALAVLAAITPLPVWGIAGFGVVTVGLVVGLNSVAHFAAIILWTVLAAALLFGAITGASSAPAASLLFALLACSCVALHVVGLRYRRALTT